LDAAAIDATYSDTASISASLSVSPYGGMLPTPFFTALLTFALSGFMLSRFGPIVPALPAAFSVWHSPQGGVALSEKICFPLGAVCAWTGRTRAASNANEAPLRLIGFSLLIAGFLLPPKILPV
jgi:hypothetical protein